MLYDPDSAVRSHLDQHRRPLMPWELLVVGAALGAAVVAAWG